MCIKIISITSSKSHESNFKFCAIIMILCPKKSYKKSVNQISSSVLQKLKLCIKHILCVLIFFVYQNNTFPVPIHQISSLCPKKSCYVSKKICVYKKKLGV